MRFLKPLRIPLFERLLPSLQLAFSRRTSKLFAGSLLFEILLSHHVQLSVCRQLCFARRLLSRALPDFVSRPFFRSSAVSCAMTVEDRHATHDERRQSDQHKKTHRFKFSRHDSAKRIMRISRWQDLMANLAPGTGKSTEKAGGAVA